LLNIFKKIFYYKECYNCKTLIDKLKCIDRNIKIEPYSDNYNSLRIRSLELNVFDYIDVMNDIIKGLDNDSVNIKRVTENSIKDLRFNLWFTDSSMKIITEPENLWKKYSSTALELAKRYEYLTKDMSRTKEYGISIKLRPYIINIEDIVDVLIENQIEKE